MLIAHEREEQFEKRGSKRKKKRRKGKKKEVEARCWKKAVRHNKQHTSRPMKSQSGEEVHN